MKIVVNKCYGGFSVSKRVYDKLGIKWNGYGYLTNEDFGISNENYDAYRADPRVIKIIEEIGEKEASGHLAELQIIDIPDGIEWEIDDYDGKERIDEVHRSW